LLNDANQLTYHVNATFILLLFCWSFFAGYVRWKSRWCRLHAGNETSTEASYLPHMIRRDRTNVHENRRGGALYKEMPDKSTW